MYHLHHVSMVEPGLPHRIDLRTHPKHFKGFCSFWLQRHIMNKDADFPSTRCPAGITNCSIKHCNMICRRFELFRHKHTRFQISITLAIRFRFFCSRVQNWIRQHFKPKGSSQSEPCLVLISAGQNAKRCRFSSPIGPQQAEAFALLYTKADASNCIHIPQLDHVCFKGCIVVLLSIPDCWIRYCLQKEHVPTEYGQGRSYFYAMELCLSASKSRRLSWNRLCISMYSLSWIGSI